MTSRAAFLDAVRSMIGAGVHHMGRTRERVDCVGLVIVAMRAAGIPVPAEVEAMRYPPFPPEQTLESGLRFVADLVDDGRYEPGDLLQCYLGKEARHCAVLAAPWDGTGLPVVIHANPTVRKVQESTGANARAVWRLRTEGAQ